MYTGERRASKIIICFVLFNLYIMLATCYFVPWIFLLQDNLTFYIHIAAINMSKFFYLTFFLDIHIMDIKI